MLRVIPSQRDRAYRLCRLVRREARLGLQAAVVHNHPDTQTCIQQGMVPIATLPLWAVSSPLIIRELRDRDLWNQQGGDPTKIADSLDALEADRAREIQAAADEELDHINSDAYRQIRFGLRAAADMGLAHERAATNARAGTLPALPALPPLNPPIEQGGSVVGSATPPVTSPAAAR
jgi:hypothetical protein